MSQIAILAQDISCSKTTLLQRVVSVCVLLLPRRSLMPRGWSQMPNGWWQRSLRVPRPPSESWPRAWESNGRSTSAVQKTPKVQGRVQCLQAAVAALGPEDGAARTAIEAALQRARDEKPADQSHQRTRWTPDVVQERARVRGHQARTSSSSHGRSEVCRGRHVAGSFKASSPISARTSSRQSNFRVHTFHRAVDTSPRKDRRRTEGGGGSSRRGTFPIGASRSSIQDVPTRCVHEHCHQNRCGRDCRNGGVEGEVSFHGAGARRGTGCASLQTASDVTHSHGPRRDPSTNPRFDDPRRIVILDGRPTRRVVRGHHSWGPGSHSETDVSDGRVRRTVASVDQRQDILRIVNSRYGLRGVRVGEAPHPGPACKRRWTQRMRGVPWSWDSDSEDEQPLVRVPSDVVEALEHDLSEGCRDPATTQLSSTVLASVVPTTVPASSGSFREHRVRAVQRGQESHAPRPSRRLVLVPQSEWERDAGAESHNRFSPLQDTVSSDDEPLVGRSAAPTDLDATMTTALSSILPASSRALARVHSRIDDDGSDEDRSCIRNVWARVGDSHERVDPQADGLSIGWGIGNASQCPVVTQNRFSALREDRDVPVAHTEPIAVALDADDTESVVSRSSTRSAAADDSLGRIHVVHRRLRLVWDPEQNLSSEVHAAATMIRSLADRVGPMPRGSIVPGAIRRQRWSVMYVPLMWAAAGQAASCPLLEWLVLVTSGVSEPVTLFGGEMPASVAARVGWESLRHAMRS